MKKLLILAASLISIATHADAVKTFKTLSTYEYQLSDIPVLFPDYRLINVEDVVDVINEVGELDKLIYAEDVYKDNGLSLGYFNSGHSGYTAGEPFNSYAIAVRLGVKMDYAESIVSSPILFKNEYYNFFVGHRFTVHETHKSLSIKRTGDYQNIIIVNKDSVHEIPLPASAWLFSSALLGLGTFVKRK